MVGSVVGRPQDGGGGVGVVEVVSDQPDVGVVVGSRGELSRDGVGGETRPNWRRRAWSLTAWSSGSRSPSSPWR